MARCPSPHGPLRRRQVLNSDHRRADSAASMNQQWYELGIPHIWRPYCQMQVAPPPLPVVRTHGCRIVLADGRELIDGIASWWSVCHGYNHPHILESVASQLATMPHVMFGGLVHEPALALARRLTAMAPQGLTPRLLLGFRLDRGRGRAQDRTAILAK